LQWQGRGYLGWGNTFEVSPQNQDILKKGIFATAQAATPSLLAKHLMLHFELKINILNHAQI